MAHKLALIGFGTVAQGFAKLLLTQAGLIQQQGAEFQVVAISTHSRGSVVDPSGLDVNAALEAVQSGTLDNYPGGEKGWDNLKIINESGADIVVENTLTNLDNGEPALSHFKAALQQGRHVVTANKGPVVLAYPELKSLAKANNAHLLIEGTVMSGTPVLNLAHFGLGGSRIHEVQGILNGTTNYILTQMETGMSYDDALKQAQDLGFAEADPTADVEGWDALAKVVILANVLMGADLKVNDVDREGITHISIGDVEKAKADGQRWKLIGRVKKEGDAVNASVKPMLIPLSDPLAAVGAAMNAITFYTDVLKSVTITGAGAGGPQTGFAILSDLLELHRRLS